jgi:major histocompatibility complex class I
MVRHPGLQHAAGKAQIGRERLGRRETGDHTTAGVMFRSLEWNESLKSVSMPGLVVHAFNPSTREAEAGGSLSSRPAWSTE